MAQVEYRLQLINTGMYDTVNKTITIPTGKVWEILGFRLEIFPELVGERTIYFAVEVGGAVIFEAFAPVLTITEQFVTSGSPSVVTGLRGIPTQFLPPVLFTGAHAIFQMPNKVILPGDAKIKVSVTTDPNSPDERKNIRLLIDESLDIGNP